MKCAVVKWIKRDGISDAIGYELEKLDYEPVFFLHSDSIPDQTKILLTFAPYNRMLPILKRVAQIPPNRRPFFIHFFMENPPDLRIPWMIVKHIGRLRVSVDGLHDSSGSRSRLLLRFTPLYFLDRYFHKFRFLGENILGLENSIINLLCFSSQIYSNLYLEHGYQACFIPWGTSPLWFDDLNIERDIDVLWFGIRRSRRRSRLLDQIRDGLTERGYRMHVADNIENPFIYGDERVRYLNRSKITLNLLPNWYDNAFPYRYHVAAGNRSLVVSETILNHIPDYIAGENYVSSSITNLVDTIEYYINHEEERLTITENAYKLVTHKLTMKNTVESILNRIQQFVS